MGLAMFGRKLIRKLIIDRIKKSLDIDILVNLKFTLYSDGRAECVLNMKRIDDKFLDKKELEEIVGNVGSFERIEASIEQVAIKFTIYKNGTKNEVEF